MSSWRTQAEPFFNRAAVTHHERELPHDDFRRAHYDFRDGHYDYRRSYYDFRTTVVTPMSVPSSAFGNKTSGGREEGDNAGK